jgi:hypothetical protein
MSTTPNDKQDGDPAVHSSDSLCGRCAGCGKIANDDDGTPWKYWAELPVQSAAAVIMGLVKPLECPDCHGTGKAA